MMSKMRSGKFLGDQAMVSFSRKSFAIVVRFLYYLLRSAEKAALQLL